MIKGIAIDPNLISSSKLNLIPKKIIPNFKIYCCVKSKPTIMPGLGVLLPRRSCRMRAVSRRGARERPAIGTGSL